MGRPPDYEWAVLDEPQDPIPGDPVAIRAESQRLGKMAQTISDQINLLKNIAGAENIGQFADKLGEKANELTGDLGKVAKRYSEVSGYLGNWANDLDYCQSESLKALAKAQQVAPTANAAEIKPAPGSPPPPPPTPQQQQAAAAAAKAKAAAQSELADAKKQLDNAKSHRDDRGNYWKNKIEDSDHDDLKDSWWDGFKDFIHEHAGLIKLLADVLTWVATALVIASLFIPGLNIATGLLLVIMGAALLGHTALALSGDGSWTDVAFDVVGMLTLGVGKVAGSALEGTVDTAEGLSKALQGGAELEEGGQAVAEASMAGAEEATSEGLSLSARMSTIGKNLLNGGKMFVTGSEPDMLENLGKLNKIVDAAGDSKIFQMLGQNGNIFANTARSANLIGTGFDQFGHWAGGSDTLNFGANLFSGKAFEGWQWSHPGTWNVNVENNFAPKLDGFANLKDATTAEMSTPVADGIVAGVAGSGALL